MRICAWCQQEMPSGPESEGLVTHGICLDCANILSPNRAVALTDYLDGLMEPVLVVDDDCRASFGNAALRKAQGLAPREVAGRLGGEVFSCVHAKAPERCGHTVHCSGCVIRGCVARTWRTGETQALVPATLKVGDPQDPGTAPLLVTTVKRGEEVLLRVVPNPRARA